jgi:hypothetical protein
MLAGASRRAEHSGRPDDHTNAKSLAGRGDDCQNCADFERDVAQTGFAAGRFARDPTATWMGRPD